MDVESEDEKSDLEYQVLLETALFPLRTAMCKLHGDTDSVLFTATAQEVQIVLSIINPQCHVLRNWINCLASISKDAENEKAYLSKWD